MEPFPCIKIGGGGHGSTYGHVWTQVRGGKIPAIGTARFVRAPKAMGVVEQQKGDAVPATSRPLAMKLAGR